MPLKLGKNNIQGIRARWMVNSLGLIVLILICSGLIFCTSIYNFYNASITDQLESKAVIVANYFNKYINRSQQEFYSAAVSYTDEYSEKDKIEMQIIRPTGEVMVSSSGSVTDYEPGTPDAKKALEAQSTERFLGVDKKTGQRVVSVTTPLRYTNGDPAGGMRFVSATKYIDERIVTYNTVVVIICLIIFLFVFVSNTYFIRSIITPLSEINNTAKKIAAGNYSVQIAKKFDDEIGELGDTINFMASEIARAEQIKNDFIASVSHELRTPLTAITGWAETLQSGEQNIDDMGKRGLAVIVRESEHLRAMLEELLDFSRMQSGRLTVSKTYVDIAETVEDVAFVFNQRLRQEGMSAVVYNEVGELPVFCDSSRMRQVFINLIDNARKHASEGKVINITVSREDSWAVVTVRDFGSGIAPEDIGHIKEKFYKGASKMPGSGIGLALCDEIVRMHDGTIDIESQVGQGTSVYVRLPLIKT